MEFCYFVLHDAIFRKSQGPFYSSTPIEMNEVSVLSNGLGSVSTWLLDLGVSHHLTLDLAHMHDSIPCNGYKGIIVGYGSKLSIDNIGFGALYTNSSSSFSVNHILHTLYAHTNLLSFQKLCAKNYVFVHVDSFCVKDVISKMIIL